MDRTPWLDAFEAACDGLARQQAPVADWSKVGARFLKEFQMQSKSDSQSEEVTLIRVLGQTVRGQDYGWRFTVVRFCAHEKSLEPHWYTRVNLIKFVNYVGRDQLNGYCTKSRDTYTRAWVYRVAIKTR